VIALDTNVLARWILQDDTEQADIAEAILAGPCWVGTTVMLELGWVLLNTAKLPRAAVFGSLTVLLAMPTLQIERHREIRWALSRFKAGGDLADMVHLAAVAKVDQFATFDQKLARMAGSEAPVPIIALGV
jgi:predicted nucleic-acid-binding protein